MTPLDVVRVRLQSQTPPSSLNPSILATDAPGNLKNLPADLGISSCCREIFWIGDNGQLCILDPNTATLRTSQSATTAARPSSVAEAAAECAAEETQRKNFTSTLDGLRKISRNEGLWTLWRGLSPTLMMSIPANVLYFAGYDWLRYDDRSIIKQAFSESYAPLVAGSFARVVSASAISPIEMFRTRLQAIPGHGAGHFKATFESLHKMTQASGYSSLWRGLTLTMWRDVPFSGLYWWGYEEVKKNLIRMRQQTFDHRHHQHKHLDESNASTFFESFLAGALSGSLAALVTTPFDVGKTRQQVFRQLGDDLPPSVSRNPLPTGMTIQPEQLSLPKFLIHIFREEGIGGLFRGWFPRCLKVAPACAIMISTYEIGKKMARDVNEGRHFNNMGEPEPETM